MNDFIDKFSKVPLSQRILILIVLLAVIGVLFYMLLFQSVEDEIVNEKGQTAQLVEQESKLRVLIDQRQKNKDEIEELEAQQRKNLEKLPKQADIPQVLGDIYKHCKLNKIQILRFEPLDEEPEEYYVRIPIEIELLGTYGQVTDFFYAVERMERIVNIENISLKKNMQNPGLLNVLCVATTFRYGTEGRQKSSKKRKRGRR